MTTRAIVLSCLLFLSIPLFAEIEDEKMSHSLVVKGGYPIPLSDMHKRVTMNIPYFSIAYRIIPPYKYSQMLYFEVEAGFFSQKSRGKIYNEKILLFSEPVMFHVMPRINLWKELYLLPRFGLGFIFNQAKGGASSGAYNHVGCAAGIEVYYRFSSSFSLNIQASILIGFDKNRILYHVVPNLGAAYFF